jgi:hypothetical protein
MKPFSQPHISLISFPVRLLAITRPLNFFSRKHQIIHPCASLGVHAGRTLDHIIPENFPLGLLGVFFLDIASCTKALTLHEKLALVTGVDRLW